VETAQDERLYAESSGSGWRVNTAKRRATGRKMRLITDVARTALGKEKIAVRLYTIWDE
jgi:hypothetical protein